MTKQEIVKDAYAALRAKGIIHTQGDFAQLLGVNRSNISRALNGDERYLTDSLLEKVLNALDGKTYVPGEWVKDFPSVDAACSDASSVNYLTVIPTEAMAGRLGDFSSSVAAYECEKMLSPIKGADYAMKVCGESMAPEYPNGSQILIKKVNENAFIEWGKVYVLDTDNGPIIKKVRKTEKADVVECVSLNPDYQPFEINTTYIRGWYRVLMVLSLK